MSPPYPLLFIAHSLSCVYCLIVCTYSVFVMMHSHPKFLVAFSEKSQLQIRHAVQIVPSQTTISSLCWLKFILEKMSSTVTDDNLESVGLHLYQKRCLYWLTFIFEKKESDFKVGTLAGVLAGFFSMSMLNTKGSVNTWFQKPRQVNPHLDWIVVCGPLSGIPKRPIYVQITGQNEALFRRKKQVKLQVGRKRRKFTNMSICMLRICCSVSRPIFMHRRSFSFF